MSDSIKKFMESQERFRRQLEPLSARLGTEFQQMQEMVAAHGNQFRLPEIAEAANLLREFENSGAARLIEQFRQEQSTIQQAMESMRAPWLDMENRIASITGFVEMPTTDSSALHLRCASLSTSK